VKRNRLLHCSFPFQAWHGGPFLVSAVGIFGRKLAHGNLALPSTPAFLPSFFHSSISHLHPSLSDQGGLEAMLFSRSHGNSNDLISTGYDEANSCTMHHSLTLSQLLLRTVCLKAASSVVLFYPSATRQPPLFHSQSLVRLSHISCIHSGGYGDDPGRAFQPFDLT
jgi:hypothetical protein